MARHNRPEADDQGAPREAAEVVLRKNPQSIVENEQFKKNKREELSPINRLKASNQLFFCYRESYAEWVCVRNKTVAQKWCKAEKSVEG
jgi:hypothetical protein